MLVAATKGQSRNRWFCAVRLIHSGIRANECLLEKGDRPLCPQSDLLRNGLASSGTEWSVPFFFGRPDDAPSLGGVNADGRLGFSELRRPWNSFHGRHQHSERSATDKLS